MLATFAHMCVSVCFRYRALRVQVLECMFLMALVWSVGTVCDTQGRVRFDAFLRRMLKGAQRCLLLLPDVVIGYDIYCVW